MALKLNNNIDLEQRLKELPLAKGSGATELARHMQLLGWNNTQKRVVKIGAETYNISIQQLKTIKNLPTAAGKPIYSREEIGRYYILF